MRLKLLTLTLAASALHAESGYKITGRFPVPGNGGWDYVTIDSTARRIYVSHATQVEVVDADNGKLIGTIADTPGVHGIAIAPGNRGFTSNGKENKVSIFDTKTLKLIEKIDVGKGPDGIFYEAVTKRVFTNNHGSSDITAIDAASGKVVGTVKLEGAGEQMINGHGGLLYVNLEDKNEVVAFDPKTLEVKKRLPIGVGQTPTGLAFDDKTNRLFIGCRSKTMVVMDAESGKVITNMPIAGGVDWGVFDPKTKNVFMSNGEGTLAIFHQKSADEYEDLGALTTQPSAKTMAFDAKTGKIYLPAAEIETIPAKEPGGRPTRKNKEGTFTLLIVSK